MEQAMIMAFSIPGIKIALQKVLAQTGMTQIVISLFRDKLTHPNLWRMRL